MTGWRPPPVGRYTSARRTTPSSIRMATSQSICLPSRLSLLRSGVGAVAQNDRRAAAAGRAIHVGTQDDAVVHQDGDVPIDLHAVADFAAQIGRGGRSPE